MALMAIGTAVPPLEVLSLELLSMVVWKFELHMYIQYIYVELYLLIELYICIIIYIIILLYSYRCNITICTYTICMYIFQQIAMLTLLIADQ